MLEFSQGTSRYFDLETEGIPRVLPRRSVLIVLAIAVAAPLLAEIPVGVRLPVVVLEMVLGIIIGPQVLGLATAEGLLGWLGGSSGWRLCSLWRGWNPILNGFEAAP